MKSEDRHRLETNVVAERLAEWIERLRPYAASLAGILLFVFIAMFAWSYMSSSTSAWQGQAWDAYNEAVVAGVPNMDMLRQSAQEHPGTKMQELADTTWADGQVLNAAVQYLSNRPAANEALNRAASAYRATLQSSDDERLLNRARLGLARIYELQDQLDEARDEYLKVTGGFAKYAKARAKALGQPKTKDACTWLASAELARRALPMGPGTPGRGPEFTAGDVPLPNVPSTEGAPTGGKASDVSFGNLLQGLDLGLEPAESPDRYPADGKTPAGETDGKEKTDAAQPAAEPAGDGADSK